MGRNRLEITQEQKNFILDNYKKLSVSKISEHLHISSFKITETLHKLKLRPLRKNIEVDWDNGIWDDTLHRELFRY